jgi:hypothetical protein
MSLPFVTRRPALEQDARDSEAVMIDFSLLAGIRDSTVNSGIGTTSRLTSGSRQFVPPAGIRLRGYLP